MDYTDSEQGQYDLLADEHSEIEVVKAKCCGNCRFWSPPKFGPLGKCNAFYSSVSFQNYCGAHRDKEENINK